jgi:serine phosphatase RsbU (regulator of sigma subunit)
MSLSAELQWDMLLPPLAFRSADVAVAGKLEPAYDVGGDGFDYSLNDNLFSFVFLDAMGHNLRSALASGLVLAGSRHARRLGLDLVETALQIDQTLIEEFSGEIFVSGHLGQLDVSSGRISWINAGHPDPLLARGIRVVGDLHAAPCKPFGLGIQVSEVGESHLEAGDRVLFYSDGVVEARPKDGDEFGYQRLVEHFERHLSNHLLAAETLRRITAEVMTHRAGPLRDDASLMMLEWRPATG